MTALMQLLLTRHRVRFPSAHRLNRLHCVLYMPSAYLGKYFADQ